MVLAGLLVAGLVAGNASAQTAAQAPGVTLAHTEQREIASKKIGQRYDLLVSLPHDYETSGKRYPVLYVLDGWHFSLMAFLQNNNIYSEKMPPVVIVNISHGEDAPTELRGRDFTPVKTAKYANSGGAKLFLEFMEQDVIPFVDRTYRTIPTDRGLLGHSLGGLFALYALEQRPTLFQRLVVASPAMARDDGSVVAALSRMKALPSRVRLDLSVGGDAPDDPRTLPPIAKALEGIKGLEYRSTVYPGENHNSVRLASFPPGMYWVYRPAGSR